MGVKEKGGERERERDGRESEREREKERGDAVNRCKTIL